MESELVALIVTYKSHVKIVKSNLKNVRSNIKAKIHKAATFPKNFTIQYENKYCDTMMDMDDDRHLLIENQTNRWCFTILIAGKMQTNVNLQQMKQEVKPHNKLITI